jgi:Glycolipid transfer protein (GLTP)
MTPQTVRLRTLGCGEYCVVAGEENIGVVVLSPSLNNQNNVSSEESKTEIVNVDFDRNDDVKFQCQQDDPSSAAAAAKQNNTVAGGPLNQIAVLLETAMVLSNNDIDLTHLLSACWEMEALMRSTGNLPVAIDFRQNLCKVQAVINQAPHGGCALTTVSALLEYEKTVLRSHSTSADGGKIVAIADPSAAMGLLWVRRNLAFQLRMYRNVLTHNMRPPQAAQLAHARELEPYVSKLHCRMFQLGLRMTVPRTARGLLTSLSCAASPATAAASPTATTPSTLFTATDEAAARQTVETYLLSLRPLLTRWEQVFAERGYFE